MDTAVAAVAASVQADRAQLLFRLAGSSPCVVGDWPRIDLLVLKDGTCVKELWHAPTLPADLFGVIAILPTKIVPGEVGV